jgi:UDP:flavonoid glycosyltransferase YjiC (YdhE family)
LQTILHLLTPTFKFLIVANSPYWRMTLCEETPIRKSVIMRVLVLPYGNSVAHVSRVLEIAKVLRIRGHELIFAGSGKCLNIAKQENFSVLELLDVSLEQVVIALRTGNFSLLYGSPSEMADYVQAELTLYQQVKPDLVLTDDRRTALISTTLANLPHAAVVNAHVTNYSQFPLLLPILGSCVGYPLPKALSTVLYQLQVHIERQVYNSALKGFQSVQRNYGLEPAFAYQVAQGKDLTLIADTPQFTPLLNPPQNFHYVGPITWQSDLPEPKFLEQFKSYKRRAYLVLGSGGFKEFFKYLPVFERLDVAIAIAAGELVDEAPPHLPDNIFVEQYINADALLPYCDVLICHGGNGTIYQALRHGVPVISIPSHNEQDYNARRVQQLGMGKRLSHERVWGDFGHLVQALEDVVSQPRHKQAAQTFQSHLKQWQGPVQAADLIEAKFSSTHHANLT